MLIVVLCAAFAGYGCAESGSTQVVVLMDTDYAVPSEVDRIRARVSKVVDDGTTTNEVETWSKEFALSSGAASGEEVYGLPSTFGVLPADGDVDREIVVELEALDAQSGRPLASRRARTGFIAGETRLLRLAIYRACQDVLCGFGETCSCAGEVSCAVPACIDELVPPDELETIVDPRVLPPDAGIPIPDAGVPPDDGGVPDGGPPIDGGMNDGGVEPDGGMPDGGINCDPPLQLCGIDCVDTTADPRYCGDCETECASGWVCEGGRCVDPGDCRINDTGCTGFSYCDETTGECLPGCIDSVQCEGENEVCDAELHECVCSPGFEACEAGCIDTQRDPSFCGNCFTACPTGFVCDAGSCIDPGDCRTNGVGCTGFTYCDVGSGECLRGCELDEQCPEPNEVCDLDTHECVCEAGFHSCGTTCVSSSSVDTCGTRCTPCTAPDNGIATCEAELCGFICDVDFEPCDQACCPTSCPPDQTLYAQRCAAVHLDTADDQGNRGEYTSIALDALGRPRIAYYEKSGRNLVYTEQVADASWQSESPDGPDNVGKHASLAIDSAGLARIAYFDESDKSLLLATQLANGSWRIDTVDGDDEVGEYTSLALDANQVPHISYYDKSNKALKYATLLGSVWISETVDGDADIDVGKHTSITVGADGRVHISYYEETGKNLRYAAQLSAGGSWTIDIVDESGDVGEYTSIALHPSGRIGISYYDQDNKDLRYAAQTGGSEWSTEAIESAQDVGKHSSLAFDASGRARVSYYGETNKDLRYAVGRIGVGWSVSAVDVEGDAGEYTSIAVDELGRSHISYYDSTDASLGYALIAAPQ